MWCLVVQPLRPQDRAVMKATCRCCATHMGLGRYRGWCPPVTLKSYVGVLARTSSWSCGHTRAYKLIARSLSKGLAGPTGQF